MCPGCTSAGGSIRKISPRPALTFAPALPAIAELKRTLGGSDASTQIVQTLPGQFGLEHVTSSLWLGCRHLPVIGSVGRSFELCRVPPLDTPVAAGDGQCHHRRCRCVVSARGMERHCPHFGSRTGPYRCQTGSNGRSFRGSGGFLGSGVRFESHFGHMFFQVFFQVRGCFSL
jgi:hypothetical protein